MLQWTKNSLTTGVYYQFKVSAINAIGESTQSVAVMLIAATVPDVPSTPIMLAAEEDFITIGWSAPNNGGDDIDDYEVDWKIDTNDLFSTIQSSNNQLQFTVEGLRAGRLYQFRVRAKNDVGLSESTPEVTFMAARVPGKPLAPSKLSAD